MQASEIYKGYTVRQERGEFVASPADKDEDFQVEIVGRSFKKVAGFIDQMWDAADKPFDQQPRWVQIVTAGSLVARIDPAAIMRKSKRVVLGWFTAGSLACLACASPVLAKALDYDGDGTVTMIDIFALAQVAVTGNPEWHGTVLVGDHYEDVTIRPTATKAAFHITKHTKMADTAVMTADDLASTQP